MSYIVGMKIKTLVIALSFAALPALADDLDDYVAAVYGGRGDFVRAGSTYIGSNDIITKCGSSYVSSRGIANRAGRTYISEDNRTVNRAGSTFIKDNDIITRVGSSYVGNDGITTSAGGYISKPGK